MIIQVYIKPGIIGLCFTNQVDRDMLWTLLADNQHCAERFGERTIRFNPAKATGSFNIPLEAETLRVVVDKAAPTVAKPEPEPAPVPPAQVPVMPAAPAPIPPVMIIPGLDQAVLATLEQPNPEPQPPVAQLPPAMIEMPQVSSVTEAPKPPDLRSRAGRAWKQQQEVPLTSEWKARQEAQRK